MYRKHFALTAFPFDRTPAPDELFVSTSLTEAMGWTPSPLLGI